MQNLQMTRAIRLSNAIQDGMTGSNVVAALAESGLKASFGELLRRRGYGAQLAQNTSLIGALFNNAATRSLITSSPYALRTLLTDYALRTALFADATAMAAFAASDDAMKALARMIGPIIAEAMSSATAYGAISAVPSAKATLLSSPALTKVSVPKMTSNSTPSGAASASSIYGAGYEAWRALDEEPSTFWNSDGTYPSGSEWIRYSFPADVHITRMTILPFGEPYSPKNCVIEFSANGTSFSPAKSISLMVDGEQEVDISQYGFYRHWRLRVTSGHSATPDYIVVRSLNFTGFAKPS